MAEAVKRAVALAVALALLAPVAPAAGPLAPPAAHADAAQVKKLLAAGEQLFEDQEYDKVIRVLRPVTTDAAATRAQRLRALELVALSQLILGDDAAARASFERLLDIDPGFQLTDQSGSPRIREFFDEVRARVLGADAGASAALDHAAPTEAPAARRLELDVRVTAGEDHVKEVRFFVRRRGTQDYDEVAAAFRGGARWRVRWTPPASADPYVVEYYLEGRGLAGEPVARAGSPEAPLTIEITAGQGEARPWYRRWYVWAGAGALAAGALGAIWLAGGADEGSLPPGTVTVTP